MLAAGSAASCPLGSGRERPTGFACGGWAGSADPPVVTGGLTVSAEPLMDTVAGAGTCWNYSTSTQVDGMTAGLGTERAELSPSHPHKSHW